MKQLYIYLYLILVTTYPSIIVSPISLFVVKKNNKQNINHVIFPVIQYSKQVYSIQNEMKKLKNEMRWKRNRSMKWSWFEVPVEVEQINEYLFSDSRYCTK